MSQNLFQYQSEDWEFSFGRYEEKSCTRVWLKSPEKQGAYTLNQILTRVDLIYLFPINVACTSGPNCRVKSLRVTKYVLKK